MTREQTPTRSSENLTRRQKLLRRAVPLALLTAGIGGGGAYLSHETSKADSGEQEAFAQATSHKTATAEIGGSESGWTQGAAERALQTALYNGAVDAFANINVSDGTEFTITTEEIKEIVEALPTYDQAGEVLDEANVGDVIPDKGDKLSVEVAVTADTDKRVEYEIVSAHIKDIPNNQN